MDVWVILLIVIAGLFLFSTLLALFVGVTKAIVVGIGLGLVALYIWKWRVVVDFMESFVRFLQSKWHQRQVDRQSQTSLPRANHRSAPRTPGRASEWWFYRLMGDEYGPVSYEQIRRLALDGTIQADTEVRPNTETAWHFAHEVKGLFHPPTAPAEQPQTPPPSQMKACPYCGETILAIATKCKHCGEFLDVKLRRQARPAPAAPQPVKQKPKQTISLGGVLLLCILGLCCFGVWGDCGSTRNGRNTGGSSSPTPRSSEPDKIGAWVMAQQFVEERLKSPSTADYGSVWGDYQNPDDVVTSIGARKFRVRAWVDAQNAFGATVRNHFVCELEYLGNDRWRCTSLVFLD